MITLHRDLRLHYVPFFCLSRKSLKKKGFKLLFFFQINKLTKYYILRVKHFFLSYCASPAVLYQNVPNNTNFHHFIFGEVFFFFPPSPISVPTHYRILSVPLPCLILIFPLVGFISFLSPLTFNSPTLKLHTNHSSFNTLLRLAGIILWKKSTKL